MQLAINIGRLEFFPVQFSVRPSVLLEYFFRATDPLPFAQVDGAVLGASLVPVDRGRALVLVTRHLPSGAILSQRDICIKVRGIQVCFGPLLATDCSVFAGEGVERWRRGVVLINGGNLFVLRQP